MNQNDLQGKSFVGEKKENRHFFFKDLFQLVQIKLLHFLVILKYLLLI